MECLAFTGVWHQDAFKCAILHHPMVPFRGIALPDLSGVSIFVSASTNDPICSASETEELQKLPGIAGAAVSVHWERIWSQFTATEMNAAAKWIKGISQCHKSSSSGGTI